MKKNSEKLEEKFKKSDWKEWIPAAGFPIAIKNYLNYKPSVISEFETNSKKYWANCVYQSISIIGVGVGLTYGLSQLIEKLF